jgi:hypothetical protein
LSVLQPGQDVTGHVPDGLGVVAHRVEVRSPRLDRGRRRPD